MFEEAINEFCKDYISVEDEKEKFLGIIAIWGFVGSIINFIVFGISASFIQYFADALSPLELCLIGIGSAGLSILQYYRVRRVRFLILALLLILSLFYFLRRLVWVLVVGGLSGLFSRGLLVVGVLVSSSLITWEMIAYAKNRDEKMKILLIITILAVIGALTAYMALEKGIHIYTEEEFGAH
ncbi:MAG: hypothetical protein WBH62_06105 [Methanothermobacter tenebrarum]